MNRALAILGGLGLGTGLTYLMDPDRGRRRRAILRGKAIHASHVTSDGLDVAQRDLKNRVSGLVAAGTSRLRRESVDDPVLLGRVRAKLGRYCSHPSAIVVSVREGQVSLSGPIMAAEAGQLIDAIRRVKGVKRVEDRLDRHEQPDIPALQGGSKVVGEPPEFQQNYWSPAARLVAGVAGGGLLLVGLSRRGLLGSGLGLVGAGVLSRAITNLDFRTLMGIREGAQGISVQKTININAPIEQVYAFWNRLENFPRFMRHVREIRQLGGGRSHWVVTGPAGVPVEWDAEITQQIPNELIGWRSVRGSTVSNAGKVHLQANPDGSTRVHIQMTYTPPAGAVGHAVATLFGSDPKHEMDEDLARMKVLIESEAGRKVPVNPPRR